MPFSFTGNFKTLVSASDGNDYVCQLEIGKIVFKFNNFEHELGDNVAVFDNVNATIFPIGRYHAEILLDKED